MNMTPERSARFREVIRHRQADLTVILENVHDPHNISACLRSCDAVGVREVHLINTLESRSRRLGKKSSASALKWLEVKRYPDVDTCFAEVRKQYDAIFCTHLERDAVELYELDLTRRVALLFGNEHLGVSEEAIEKADGNFRIPQVGMIQSLNISVACAVSLFEAYRQRSAGGGYQGDDLPTLEQEALFERWSEREMRRGRLRDSGA